MDGQDNAYRWRKPQKRHCFRRVRRYFDVADGDDTGAHCSRNRGSGHRRARHPPGLKGREIGLWYAEQGRKKRAATERQSGQFIDIATSQQRQLTSLLSSIQRDVPPQPDQSYQSLSDTDSDDGFFLASFSDRNPPSTAFDDDDDDDNDAISWNNRYESTSSVVGCDSNQGDHACSTKIPLTYVKQESANQDDELDLAIPSSDDEELYSFSAAFDFQPVASFFEQSSSMNTGERVTGGPQRHDSRRSMECSDDSDDELTPDACKLKVEGVDDVTDFISEFVHEPAATQPSENIVPKNLQLQRNVSLDVELKQRQSELPMNHQYKTMIQFRKNLPSYQMQQNIVRTIADHRVVVISGETGCGKTTQVPQFILDDYISQGKGSLCRVVCTQPRRISAISVAQRVAEERGESLGESVGYQIRLDQRLPRDQGSILYCTTGILLKWLVSDPLLAETSHVVLDEIHERDTLSDFLMIVVRDLLQRRHGLKVVLMSATLNAEEFASYFGNCAILNIPGFTFPVRQFLLEDVFELLRYDASQLMLPRHSRGVFPSRVDWQQRNEMKTQYSDWMRQLEGRYSAKTLECLAALPADGLTDIDYNVIVSLIQYIILHKPIGAILVFVPGWEQISKLNENITSHQFFKSDKFRIIPLHSLMPTVNQLSVFDRPPPGVHKIVIATNIAETSITIDDVVYVVDCGKIKMKNFDVGKNIVTLLPEWVSRANAKQRSGRAGRVQPGECYHLYTAFHEAQFADYQLPEMLRTRLEELCLQIKLLKLGPIKPFVAKAMQPPSSEAIDHAVEMLFDLNALDRNTEELTPLGYHLARMPVDPQVGKMLLFAAIFSCIDPIATIAASLGFRDAFYIPLGKEKEADERRRILATGTNSDHLMLANAFQGWLRARQRGTVRQYCYENFLTPSTLLMLDGMRRQFTQLLYDMKFLSNPNPKAVESNRNSNNEKLLKAVVCAGLYPNVAKLYKPKRPPRLMTKTEHLVNIHPKSVNAKERFCPPSWFVYHLKLKTRQINIHDCTVVSPFALLFFGGDFTVHNESGQNKIVMDDWIGFLSSNRVSRLVKELRLELDKLLQKCIVSPGPLDSPHDIRLLNAIIDLVTTEENCERVSHPSPLLTASRSRGGNIVLRRMLPTRAR